MFVLPEGMSHTTAIRPPGPRATMALLARMLPAQKLMVLVGGGASPAG